MRWRVRVVPVLRNSVTDCLYYGCVEKAPRLVGSTANGLEGPQSPCYEYSQPKNQGNTSSGLGGRKLTHKNVPVTADTLNVGRHGTRYVKKAKISRILGAFLQSAPASVVPSDFSAGTGATRRSLSR